MSRKFQSSVSFALFGGAALILASGGAEVVAQTADSQVTADGQLPFVVLKPSEISEMAIKTLIQKAKPMQLPKLAKLPAETNTVIDPFIAGGEPMPLVMRGERGLDDSGRRYTKTMQGTEDDATDITTFDYGSTGINLYQYTDSLVDTELNNDHPYRTTGWFVFTAYNGGSYRCTAQLIGRSILVTAGHCVHGGGGGSARWIRSGYFVPAYLNGAAPYGTATANTIYTTTGWYNVGALDQGYDLGVVVLNKRSGTTSEIGAATGTLSFCYSNCLQRYWYNTQLGYPGNYYNGTALTESEHLEVSDSRDYVYGTGMEGGSSGGNHTTNLGDLTTYTAGSLGKWPYRNVVFAVTSWGYTDRTRKMGGASTLSGPNNSNNFVATYNAACTKAQSLHGVGSCSLL